MALRRSQRSAAAAAATAANAVVARTALAELDENQPLKRASQSNGTCVHVVYFFELTDMPR